MYTGKKFYKCCKRDFFLIRPLFFYLVSKRLLLKKSLIFVLILLIATAVFADVKKKRFDIGGTSNAFATEAVAPAALAVSKPEVAESKSFYTVITDTQKDLREKLTTAISAMKSGDWSAIWKFLVICLIYGMLHALGPGHGKSVVVGYFIARRGRWRQGVALGAGITVTHTMSAVLLLLILYAIFKATVFNAFETGRIGIERASYALIMLTGVLLVVLGIRDVIKSHKDSECAARINAVEGAVVEPAGAAGALQNRVLPPVARWREIIGVAAVTGIVPCPAVALIVLFCLLNSMVALSLLGALVICIGMTITNVAFGVAAVAFRKGIDKGSAHTRIATKIYTVATLAGGAIIFISGLLLFTNQFAGRV